MRREGNRGRSEDLPLTSSSYFKQHAYYIQGSQSHMLPRHLPLVWTNGSMAQPRNSDGQSTVTWGTIRPLPCFRVASGGIRWALGGIAGPKPPKFSQTPGPSMPPIVPVYIRRGKRCVSLTPPFPSASFLSLLQPGAVQCLFT